MVHRLDRFERAGVSVARFCAREGVSVASFYKWRKKLGAPDVGRRRSRDRRAFQPVTIVPPASGVSIHLTCGHGSTFGPRISTRSARVVKEVVSAQRDQQSDDA